MQKLNNYFKQNVMKEIKGNILTITISQEKYEFDVNNLINSLYKEYGITNDIPQERLYIEKDNKKLVISSMSFEINKDTKVININNIDGYLLGK